MKYYVIFIPEDQEAEFRVCSTKDEVALYLKGILKRTGQVKIIRGDELTITVDRDIGQYFLNEEGHLPMPISKPSRQEALVDGRIGEIEPEPSYVANTRSIDFQGARPTGPGTTNKAPVTTPVEDDEDDDDDEDDGDL